MGNERKYKYISLDTGELQENIVGVIKAVIGCFVYYKFLNLRWKRGDF